MDPTVADLLPIRQLVLACRGMHPAAKAVFAEVCALYENGGRKCFDANNRFLAEKLGITIPMVSRHLRGLEQVGLLTINGTGNGERRTIAPTPDVQAAYRLDTPETLTEVVREAYRSGKGTLTEVVRNPYRSGKHKEKEVEGKKNETLTYPNVALSTSADADRARRVLELEELVKQQQETIAAQAQRLGQAKEEYRKLREEKQEAETALASAKAQLAKRTKRAVGPAPMPAFAQWFPEQVAALSADDQARLLRFYQWAEQQPLPHVFALNLTPRKVLALAAEHGAEPLKTVLIEMENSKSLDNKKSADLTAQIWLKRDAARQIAFDSRATGNQFKEQRQPYGAQSRFTDTTR
jgi:DNA-binding MarR family transcriptional regulator